MSRRNNSSKPTEVMTGSTFSKVTDSSLRALVCEVIIGGVSRGTGFVMSTSRVVTAAHVASIWSPGNVLAVRFSTSGSSSQTLNASLAVVHPQFLADPANLAWDVGYIDLQVAVASPAFTMDASSMSLAQATVVGFPGGLPLSQSSGPIGGSTATRIFHGCTTTPKNSGSPIIQTGAIVGIHTHGTGSPPNQDPQLNSGVKLRDDILQWLI